MPQFLGPGRVRYFKPNGEILSGGLLHVYEPGTVTNRNSYPTIADAIAGTNENANPVVLDAEGYANVVLKGNSKLVLADALDVTLWSLDNVNYDTDSPITDANGNESIEISTTPNAVNHIDVINAAAGNSPSIAATGDDINVGLTLRGKGTGNVSFLDGTDNSKVFSLDASGAATSTTTTFAATSIADTIITLPSSNTTLIGASDAAVFTNKAFDANGAGNSLSNVDLEDLSNGTAGELLTWDAANAPATVPTGTATHVLTSNGVGLTPTFQATVAPSTAFVLLSSASASNDATIE